MFNIEKLIQACNYLIKKNGSKINYTKLIKLLYLADRESLKKSLQTITGDSYVSMNSGPVLSRMYGLIMGMHHEEDIQVLWSSCFIRDGYDLITATDQIPYDELSAFEMQTLDDIYNKFEEYSLGQMIEYVHNNCSEWKHPGGSSIPIKPKNLLKGIGKSPKEIDWILAETDAFEEEEQVFMTLED
jgi:uncharacterized phage-associated protein